MYLAWGLILIIFLSIIIIAVYRAGFNDGYAAGQIARYVDGKLEKNDEM